MPIKIQNNLPAKAVLNSEQIFVMTDDRATHQDIRPLEILILNLMPKKINTEIQYMRQLSNTPLQCNITLLRVDEHETKNTPVAHLNEFYKSFDEVKQHKFDGMIVTGAPLDQIDFKDVNYWHHMQQILRWSTKNVTSTLFSCWGVAAALKVFYNIDMIFREDKLSGIYPQTLSGEVDTLVRGFDDVFNAPISRYCDFPLDVIWDKTDLNVLASSNESGLYLAVSPDRRQVYVSGHPEYDLDTLAGEYQRDLGVGKNPKIPVNYFPDDDPSKTPLCKWRSHAALLFANWINYYVYQETPFDIESVK